MNYCEHCGGKLESGVAYCPNCGAQVKEKIKESDIKVETNIQNNLNNTTIVKDNTTAAFVCSLIGALCCTYVAIPGLILSIQSLNYMKEGKISSEKKWMAIAGIVLSAIGIIQMIYNFINPAHNQEIIKEISDKFNINYE